MKKKSFRNKTALKGGSYSLMITALVLAILIVANVFVTNLPASMTKLDISSSKLYSITSNTKAVVNNLTQDVTIYWVVQSEQEDSIIENLLSKYDSLSSYIQVVKKNPDVFPTFAAQYTEDDVPNNSLIVESGERYRYVSYYDLYETEFDYYSYTYTASGFDGEGAITSAIDYVVTEDLPKIYLLEGHGESELPSTFADNIEKANIETEQLSLLTVDSIPEDAAALVVYSPQSDISMEEKTMLAEFTANGGKLLVMAGPVKDQSFANLNGLLSDHGVEVAEGLVIEGNRNNYALGYPYVLVPELESNDITDALIEESYYVISGLSSGLKVESSTNVTTLLTTSSEAFSKVAGYSLSTYEKEDGDIDGPFALAVSIDTGSDGQIIWFSGSSFVDDSYNAYSSGANVDLAMNALSSLVGEREALAIRSKSLNYNYLTINETTASTLKFLMIGLFPVAYLGVGVVVIVSRRRKNHETV